MGKLLPLSPVPLYSQLKELLRGRILDGVYPPLKGDIDHAAVFRVAKLKA